MAVILLGSTSITSAQTTGPDCSAANAKNNPVCNTESSYTLLEPLPCVPSPAVKDATGKITTPAVDCQTGTQITSVKFKDYVQYAFNLLIALCAVAAVFMIVWGGFEYMSSDAYNQKTDGIKKIQNALLGLLLVLCSYLILKTVDPRLVDIPTTLVKPLDIKYEPQALSGIFDQLNRDASKFRSDNMDLIKSVAEAKKKSDELDQQKADLCKQLIDSVNSFVPDPNGMDSIDDRIVPAGTTNVCQSLIDQSSILDPASRALAARIADINNQQKDLTASITTKQGVGIMNAIIQKCYGITTESSSFLWWNYGNNYDQATCLKEIADESTKYSEMLKKSGNDVASGQVLDYQKYAEAITKINSTILYGMSKSPSVKAMVDTFQSSVTTLFTIAGTSAGGVLGGAAGFTAAQFVNAGVKAGELTLYKEAAQTTIADVKRMRTAALPTISDPSVRQLFDKQTSALITGLGGTP